jgi:hypothetical protein
MPIDFSDLSAEDIAAATAAIEAARGAREERERREAEERRKQQEEERVRQEATMRREVEQRKEVAAAERRDFLARQKVAREAVAVEEERQSLTTGLSGLKFTILAPASIARTTSGSSTQSKWKRKATEEEPSASQYVS